MAQVTIFDQDNFNGSSQPLSKGRYNDALHEITLGNDKVRSIRVPSGLVARLYDHAYFQGAFVDIKSDTSLLSSFWQTRTSSIIVYGADEKPPVIDEVVIFPDDDYVGTPQVLKPGSYQNGQLTIGDNSLSSALIPYGMVLRVYDQANLTGEFLELHSDTRMIGPVWNDRVSSLTVEVAPVGFSIQNGRNVAILGESTEFNGVRGISHAAGYGGEAAAVVGINDNSGPGVFGQSDGPAVLGHSSNWMGVYGRSEATNGGAGVCGEAVGPGVIGISNTWIGVYGESRSSGPGAGVMGEHKGGGNGVTGISIYGNYSSGVYGEAISTGVKGVSRGWVGVFGEAQAGTGCGVWGEHKADGNGVIGLSANGTGVYGKGGKLAAFFEGNVEVTGDIRLANADCAEDFDIADNKTVEPGTVMVVGEAGRLEESATAYDKRVAGVVSGAGSFKPGIVLDKQTSENARQPIALVGKVFCKVDTSYGAIEVGDLLTTSQTPGCAMKASDPLKAFGAVIGKALRPLSTGQGLIPILIALQ